MASISEEQKRNALEQIEVCIQNAKAELAKARSLADSAEVSFSLQLDGSVSAITYEDGEYSSEGWESSSMNC